MKHSIATILTWTALFAALGAAASAESFETTAKASDARLSRSLEELESILIKE